jgi:hypothetical protein
MGMQGEHRSLTHGKATIRQLPPAALSKAVRHTPPGALHILPLLKIKLEIRVGYTHRLYHVNVFSSSTENDSAMNMTAVIV